MRLIETASLWGNLYRFRYFANGKPVSYIEFDHLRRAHGFTAGNRQPMETTTYGFRVIWESEQ